MKRTKEWWARLNESERKHLVRLEKCQNCDRYRAYHPYNAGECPACGQLDSFGLCNYCSEQLRHYIAKGNGEVE